MKPSILIIVESSPVETNIFQHLLKLIPLLAEEAGIEIFFYKNADLHLSTLSLQELAGIATISACPSENENLPNFIKTKTIPELGELIAGDCKVMIF